MQASLVPDPPSLHLEVDVPEVADDEELAVAGHAVDLRVRRGRRWRGWPPIQQQGHEDHRPHGGKDQQRQECQQRPPSHLAAAGLAHFARPEAFESITATAFPNHTRRYTYVNGGIETAIGLGLIAPQTRKLAVAGLLAYGAYLGISVARNR